MSKNSCKAAESIEDAVHDNRMFAERAFYCIANGAGGIPRTELYACMRICPRDATKRAPPKCKASFLSRNIVR